MVETTHPSKESTSKHAKSLWEKNMENSYGSSIFISFVSTSFVLTFLPFIGGMRYYGMTPLISHVYESGLMEAITIFQFECFHGNSHFHVIEKKNKNAWIQSYRMKFCFYLVIAAI